MLKSLVLLIVSLVNLGASSVSSAAGVILVYGDSLSAGYGIQIEQSWPTLLAERLKKSSPVGADQAKARAEATKQQGGRAKDALCAVACGDTPTWTVANASISGETTAGGRSRFERAMTQFKPKVVVLALGANDGLRGLPVKQMQENLNAMVKLAKSARARVLLVGMRLPPNYGPEYTNAFEASFATIARDHKVAFLPFLLEPIAAQRENFQADGLHPIAAAQSKLLDHVFPALKPLLK
jgi:acyl-CoA thioesterase I